jgi:uncharacterized protein
MVSTLIDAGPLIALFDRDDLFHQRMVQCVKSYTGIFVSTWPVVTEAMHMLRKYHLNQRSLLQWIEAGGIKIVEITRGDLSDMIGIFEKYRDIPMDFADCSIVHIAATQGIDQVLTIDSDFIIYRLRGKKRFRFLIF